jgi:hypothetical protein
MGKRGSVKVRGDLHFAQAHEVTEESDVFGAVEKLERDELESQVLDLQEKLARAQDAGHYSRAQKLELELEKKVAALMDYHEGDNINPDLCDYFSLRRALTETAEGDCLNYDDRAARLEDWKVFLRFVFQDGIADPWAAFKNLLAIVRRTSPEYLDGLTATQIGILLDETKAAPSAREIRRLEPLLKRWDVRGFHLLGGTKSDEARRKYSQVQKGNTNRRNGSSRKG